MATYNQSDRECPNKGCHEIGRFEERVRVVDLIEAEIKASRALAGVALPTALRGLIEKVIKK